jgi:threonine aldolase
MIDLRSDTVTQPTEAMRQAIARAEVGDDVLGADPTVAALEARTAELLGKEDALYMPSGTMTNQVALRCHTQSGQEVLLADNAHVYWYEAGAPAAISGLMCRWVPSDRGIFGAEQLRPMVRPSNVHFAPTALLCVENTNNRGGGSAWPMEKLVEVADFAHVHGWAAHMDGARLWNAAVACGRSEAELAAPFDTVSVCFSKGLGAPVGSALVGTRELIGRARHVRKMLGGGMRQAGVIAAGALHALNHHRMRLAEDHANARALAEGIAKLDGVSIDPVTVETNIVIFRVSAMSAADLVSRLAERGVHVLATGPDEIRAVTHLHINADDIDNALAALATVLG